MHVEELFAQILKYVPQIVPLIVSFIAIILAGYEKIKAAKQKARVDALDGYARLTDDLRSEVERLKGELADMRKAQEESFADILDLKQENETLRQENTELCGRVTVLEEENCQLRKVKTRERR